MYFTFDITTHFDEVIPHFIQVTAYPYKDLRPSYFIGIIGNANKQNTQCFTNEHLEYLYFDLTLLLRSYRVKISNVVVDSSTEPSNEHLEVFAKYFQSQDND